MKTYMAKPSQEPEKRWLVIDAADQFECIETSVYW